MKIIIILLIFLVSCETQQEILGDRIELFRREEMLTTNIPITINTKLETYEDFYNNQDRIIENLALDEKDLFTDKQFSNQLVINGINYHINKNGTLSVNGKDVKKIVENPKFVKMSYHKEVIYVISGYNNIIAVDIDGNKLWDKTIGAIPISNPVIDDTGIYFITNDNKTYCIALDGEVKWIHNNPNKNTKILGTASPVLYKDYVIVSYSTGNLHILDKKNSNNVFNISLVNRTPFSFDLTDIDSTPIIINNVLIASASGGNTIALDLRTFKILWQKQISTVNKILVNNNFIYVLDMDSTFYILNLKGDLLYKKEFDTKYHSPLFANNLIYLMGDDNNFVKIDPITKDIQTHP
jgi:outer membrane protein assembly factor BamB